jgi:DNA-directed RNA polymerase subunit RPC12/RpoP
MTSNLTDEPMEQSYDNESARELNFVKTFGTTQMMVFVGIIGCIIGLMGAAMVTFEKINSKIGAVLVLLAVILSLIAPMYLMFTLPGALNEDYGEPPINKMGTDFFGSEKEESGNITSDYTWGGSTGWFLPIIAMVMCIVALILVAKSKPAEVPASTVQFTSQDSFAQPDAPVSFQPEPSMTFQPDGPVTFQPETPVSFQSDAQTPMQAQPPLQIPLAQPAGQPQGEQFECPQCHKIFILATTKRPAILRCPYCGLEGMVD